MSIKNKILKTVCPFCSFGCELSVNEINRGDFILRKMEYDTKSEPNQGRLCARGNLVTEILNHGKRLTYPLFNNKTISWTDAIKQVASIIKSATPDSIAITYDTNNTLEELNSIFSFAQDLKIDNLATTYLHPEQFFNYTMSDVKIAELNDINNAKVILIIGDVFAKSPVIAKTILDAKYADRNNRLFCIDSVKTKTAGFANKFIQTSPNTEALAVLALAVSMSKPAKEFFGDKLHHELRKIIPEICKISNINLNEIEEIAQVLLTNPHTVILSCLDFGKTDDPLLFSLAVKLLASLTQEKKFDAFVLASIPNGKVSIGNILEQIKEGKIKTLIHFGDVFPFFYPQMKDYVKNLDVIVHTSTFRNSTQLSIKNYTLPVQSLLEKNGTINTQWSKQSIKPVASSINGTKSVIDIIDLIAGNSSKLKQRLEYKINISLDDFIKRLKTVINDYSQPEQFILIGEETAFGYLGLFENNSDYLKINLFDAKKLGLKNNDIVQLEVNKQVREFFVKITTNLPNQTIALMVDTPHNRALFPMRTDNLTGHVIIGTARINLKKVE